MFGTKCEWLLSLYERVGYDILLWFLLSTPSSNKRSVENTMGEVMICRGGRGSGAGGGGSHGSNKEFVTLTFVENQNWTVPDDIVNNEVSVTVFGGGGGGAFAGGGGGWMNNGIFIVYPNDSICITLGEGGSNGQVYQWSNTYQSNRYWQNNIIYSGTGGTSSFGGYIAAPGGSGGTLIGGSGGSGGGGCRYRANKGDAVFEMGGTAYQFGGGGLGGKGGTWGGGGASADGGIYGGGGGASLFSGINRAAGNGGVYGGGGGGVGYDWSRAGIGIGGEYGGNGGNNTINAENGTNTIGWTNVEIDYNGNYITGTGEAGKFFNQSTINYGGGGGGGFGGLGGDGYSWYGGGGGGGYGGNGGGSNGIDGYGNAGGGGGYMGSGGNQFGGGGGYGWISYGGKIFGGGGGYLCEGKSGESNSYSIGGGGGGYRYAGSMYACGGSGKVLGGNLRVPTSQNGVLRALIGENGANGVCVVQYYKWVK